MNQNSFSFEFKFNYTPVELKVMEQLAEKNFLNILIQNVKAESI